MEWLYEEGHALKGQKEKVAIVSGAARRILQGERIALNLLSHLSGIATVTKTATTILKGIAIFKGTLAGSRKTLPGLRIFEKYALLVGGADTHRMSLSSCVMLKDNHIDIAGSITKAVMVAKQVAGFTTKIEVECRKMDEAIEAAEAGADIVMLDNFGPLDAQLAGKKIKDKYPHVIVEVSGGITLNNLIDYAGGPYIDVISMGALTHSAPSIDFSLKIIK